MKNLPNLSEENGFSLLESIITIFLAALTVSGLFLAWQMVETRDRNLEQYWRYKEDLELAYQITHQTLRSKAKLPTIAIEPGGQGISFTGTDNNLWSFVREGNNYKLTHGGREEVIISGICDNTLFVLNGAEVDITLGVATPANWKGIDDLNISGLVYIRNH